MKQDGERRSRMTRFGGSRTVAVAVTVAGLLAVVAAVASGAAIHVTLVSQTSKGAPANDDSTVAIGGVVSATGRFVAFE